MDRYFDYAATTPVDPRVLEAMLPWLKESWGNANSLHEPGRRARAAVERAREHVAALLGADDPAEIFFTSGATESNNWVLKQYKSIAVSPFEHSSIWEIARARELLVLDNDGWELSNSDADLTAVMAVNNETGALLSLPKGTRAALVDMTQAAGKVPAYAADADFASLSAHKFYGPKGVGALFVRGGGPIEPLICGGEQENGLRGGTMNVAGIVGMGRAAEIAASERESDFAKALGVREAVLDGLDGLADWRTLDRLGMQSPFILALSFWGLEGETLVVEMDHAGFSISSGAACSSRSTEPSHVLSALKIPQEWRRGTVRISFGRFSDPENALDLGKSLKKAALNLRNLA